MRRRATTQDILTVDATGKVAFNQMPSPCFSAFQSVAQAIAANTLTKVAFQTKEFDVTTAYDSVTNFRFTPLVAGYYQVNANFAVATSVCTMYTTIYKNGAAYKSGCELINGGYAAVNAIVQMNGTTDYIEIFASASIGQNTSAIQNGTYFQASLVQRV